MPVCSISKKKKIGENLLLKKSLKNKMKMKIYSA